MSKQCYSKYPTFTFKAKSFVIGLCLEAQVLGFGLGIAVRGCGLATQGLGLAVSGLVFAPCGLVKNAIR